MFRRIRHWWYVWRRFGVTPWQARRDRRALRQALEALRRGPGPPRPIGPAVRTGEAEAARAAEMAEVWRAALERNKRHAAEARPKV